LAHAIIDTNVYIDHWQGKLADRVLVDIRQRFIVRLSAVVLSELRRGARTSRARRFVDELRTLGPVVWEPAEADWWAAGELIRNIGDANGWETAKRREFQNDALIALTARRYGAVVVTTNVADFKLLAARVKLQIVEAR
jgi:predicted nucleic acid-binding protein